MTRRDGQSRAVTAFVTVVMTALALVSPKNTRTVVQRLKPSKTVATRRLPTSAA
jgi:hypothetical protein